jgi:hypothetical protein
MAITIDQPQTQLDTTVKIFNQFYNTELVVNSAEYEIVYSYFKDVSKSINIAKNFTIFLFRIANFTNKPVLELLDYISGKSTLEANALMVYYLNSIKSKTALYGVGSVPQPNQSILRNVVV